MPRFQKHLWKIVLVLAALVVIFAPESRAAGQRLVVKMHEPFEVNGTLFPPGELSIRRLDTYTPTATLNEIRVDGHILGVVMGQQAPDVFRAADRDSLVFSRASNGHLVLHSIELEGEYPQELHLEGLEAADLRALALKSEKAGVTGVSR